MSSKLYHSKLNNNFSTLHSYFHYRQKKKNPKNHFIVISRQLEIHLGFVIQIKPEEAVCFRQEMVIGDMNQRLSHPFTTAGPVKETSESMLES